MHRNNWLVVTPNKQWWLKIPEIYLSPLVLALASRELQLVLSQGDARFKNNVRRLNPSVILLDRWLPNSEKRHHVWTFVEWTKTSTHSLLKNSQVLEIDDKWVIQLPDSILELFSDTTRRARILTLNWKWAKLEWLALSFQQTYEIGSNGR